MAEASTIGSYGNGDEVGRHQDQTRNAVVHTTMKDPYEGNDKNGLASTLSKGSQRKAESTGDRHNNNALNTKRKRSSQQTFPFLKLPGELRNKIYQWCLQTDEIIVIKTTKVRVSKLTSQQLSGRKYGHQRVVRVPKMRHFPELDKVPNIVPAILRLNKQIHQETASMLYANHFLFADAKAMIDFNLATSRVNLKPLRTITLGELQSEYFGSSTQARKALALLSRCTELERLNINMQLAGLLYTDYRGAVTITAEDYAEDILVMFADWFSDVALKKRNIFAGLEKFHFTEKFWYWACIDAVANWTNAIKTTAYINGLAEMAKQSFDTEIRKQIRGYMSAHPADEEGLLLPILPISDE
ncbi:hypothetical protein BT63DRAFT_483694 [Microthyrium microscopicum]|uniref:DUF7730 domain-containing protein n=1 Tax=Microthyrium microscopicum TaxID=703497 RepID=A0A6A6TVY1_9PEZI|nr:hypothetical protein BT63DRAFT_483694 [Microthyrium microscopicum]